MTDFVLFVAVVCYMIFGYFVVVKIGDFLEKDYHLPEEEEGKKD